MIWPTDVATFLSAGGRPNYHLAVVLTPKDLTTGNPVTVGYWTGWEDISLSLGGVSQTLFATKGALDADNAVAETGTNIRNHNVSINGLSQQGVDLIQAYDLRFRPATLWQLCFTQGSQFMGARTIMTGKVDKQKLTIGAKGRASRLSITIASSAREGTRTLALKKSHASYLLRDGDTAAEYASLTDVDSDYWGPKG